jgi:hypothetical protein
MTLDGLSDGLHTTLRFVQANWPFFAVFGGALALFAVGFFGTAVSATEAGVALTLLGRPIYRIPLASIKSADFAPLEASVGVGGVTVWDSRGKNYLSIVSNPFVRAIRIERTDGIPVYLTPDDGDKFLRDLNAAWTAKALPGAEEVIAARIEAERREKAR